MNKSFGLVFKMPIILMIAFLYLPQFLIAQSLPAADMCVDLRNFYLATLSNSGLNRKLVCADIERVELLYDRVIAISPYSLPQSNLILSNDNRDLGEFNLMYGTISAGVDLNSQSDVRSQEIFLVHEIGHKIFLAALDNRVEFFNRLRSLREAYNNTSKAYFVPIVRRMLTNPNCQLDTECSKHAEIEMTQFQAETGNARSELKSFENDNRTELEAMLGRRGIVHHYTELYGDLVAAIFFDNPDIVTLGFELRGDKTQDCRSFIRELPSPFNNLDPHCSISKLRTNIWSQWVTPRISDKPRLLKSFADILIDDMESNLRNGTPDPDSILLSLERRFEIVK